MTQRKECKSGIYVVLCLACFWSPMSGCATMGKDECLNADWRTIGYEDGARGHQASRIGQHREACAKHGVAPDFDRYERGRLEGLREYCTPQKGYSLGRSGKGYHYVCPQPMEQAFLKGYRQGKIVYAAQATVNTCQSELNQLYKDLDAVERQLSDHEAELIKDGIGPKRRMYLLGEIKILTDEQRSLVDRVAAQEELLEDAKLNLKALEAQNP